VFSLKVIRLSAAFMQNEEPGNRSAHPPYQATAGTTAAAVTSSYAVDQKGSRKAALDDMSANFW
jgi:hypothetical protein